MSFTAILYQLFLSPLTLLLEAVYNIALHILNNCGAAIFPLSLVVNLLLLPFYNRADVIQTEEREKQKKMEPFIEHIKKTFKGDERYMMLQCYYRQNNYKPLYSLRSSIALILEVPFFIAAYNFLSNLPDLRGTSFLFLKDLAKPDALFSIGGFSINILPIVMTLINVVSSEIYTKGLKLKDKIQLHGMALIFLVLLYNSPSGLVLYWTLNNIFSLVKNLVNISADKKKATQYAFSFTGLLILLFSLFFKGDSNSKFVIFIVGLLFQIPFLRRSATSKKAVQTDKEENRLFFGGALFLTVLLGLLIPSSVINASPFEFVLMTSVHSPVRYVFFAFLTAVGAFLLWGSLFYYLASGKSRKYAIIGIWICSVLAAVNFLLFGKSTSILSSDLQFDTGLSHPAIQVLLNTLTCIVLIALVIFTVIKYRKIISFLAPVLVLGTVGLAGYNIYHISSEMPQIRKAIANTPSDKPQLTFSQDGNNVVVIMLDRSISSYIPYMFAEKPELQEQFQGFTWYPNTLSFGMRTVIAAPALFGGYDYTPDNINRRADVPLRVKHDESLLTMPVIFSGEGYDVTVLDPPFAAYSGIPDLSIYDPYPEIKAYNTELGMFRDSEESDQSIIRTWKRNFFCYSLMKASPLMLQKYVYTDGTYFSPDDSRISLEKIGDEQGHFVVSSAYMNLFRDSYEALRALPSMTTAATTSSEGSFFLIQNSTAHNTMPLQEPDYVPQYEVNNVEYDQTHTDRFTVDGKSIIMDTTYQLVHYQCNMAAFIQLGNWMDYLREIGVYDNTRIIIVSDHGWPTEQFPDMLFLDGANNDTEYNSEDAMAYNPVLLVKDFGSDASFTTDYTFMTNADTPTLAMQGLLDDPVNPFTSRPIYQEDAKYADKLYVMYTDKWNLQSDSGNVFEDTTWYSLSNQDLFNPDNWHKEDDVA